ASEMPSCNARSRSRIFGLSARARRISVGVGRVDVVIMQSSLVEYELPLARYLQPIDHAVMVDGDFRRALEEALAGYGARRSTLALLAWLAKARTETMVDGSVAVHGTDPC